MDGFQSDQRAQDSRQLAVLYFPQIKVAANLKLDLRSSRPRWKKRSFLKLAALIEVSDKDNRFCNHLNTSLPSSRPLFRPSSLKDLSSDVNGSRSVTSPRHNCEPSLRQGGGISPTSAQKCRSRAPPLQTRELQSYELSVDLADKENTSLLSSASYSSCHA